MLLGGESNSEEELNQLISTKKHHPFTGPVYINGAEKGKTVAVKIEEFELAEYVHQCLSRSSGVLKGQYKGRNYKKFQIVNNAINYEGILLKVVPSLGGTGLADPEGTRNGALCKHGGNFDFRTLVTGSVIYLPVAVQGGLLYMGDLHALQGNGEASGVALEASGKVRVTVDIHDIEIPTPMIYTAPGLLIVGYGEQFDDAVRHAVESSVKIISSILSLTAEDAYMLIGATSVIILGQLTGRIKSVAVQIPHEVMDWKQIIQKGAFL